MISDTERREVARRLRELPGDSTYPDLVGIIADHDGWYPASDAADRLADLIEPSCDRDALLALVDEMKKMPQCELCPAEIVDCSEHPDGCPDALLDYYARRIREACGEVDG